MTITEAMAERKTINKRIEKKIESVLAYLWRPEQLKDPLEKQGGSHAHVQQERQAIRDLMERKIALQAAIADANAKNTITVNGVTRSIEKWLEWRRQVAPVQQAFLRQIRVTLNAAHNQTPRQVAQGLLRQQREDAHAGERPIDVVVNLDEKEFNREVEALEDTLGQLDGQLSLKNSTINLNV